MQLTPGGTVSYPSSSLGWVTPSLTLYSPLFPASMDPVAPLPMSLFCVIVQRSGCDLRTMRNKRVILGFGDVPRPGPRTSPSARSDHPHSMPGGEEHPDVREQAPGHRDDKGRGSPRGPWCVYTRPRSPERLALGGTPGLFVLQCRVLGPSSVII